jgi:hypothetical protein
MYASLRHLDAKAYSTRFVVDTNPELRWQQDPMAWVGLLIGPSIWAVMTISLSLRAAWISWPCGALIGFFLWLIALGYDNPRMAKATVWGVGINLVLAAISAYYAFIAIP